MAALVAFVAYPSLASHRESDTIGRSTLQQTIIGDDQNRVDDFSNDQFSFLSSRGPGEDHVVREALAKAQPGRKNRRDSLVYLGQLTDFQLSDEESPARVEFVDKDPSGTATSAWRPQEAMVAYQVEYSIRQLNQFVRSPVREGGGHRARLANAVLTGDLADNMQLNETRWVVRLLEGGRVDPRSGTQDLAGTSCEGQEGTVRDYEHPRRYTGVQDYDDYPPVNPDGDKHYYDPDDVEGDYAANGWPTYHGLMNRAQRPFHAQGLRIPSYVAFGNHDALVQGNQFANRAFNRIAKGCEKLFPGVDPGLPDPPPGFEEEFPDGFPEEVFEFLADPPAPFVQRVPPDDDRRFIDHRKFKALHDTGEQPDEHGFAYVDRDELRASDRHASYYDFEPRNGIRYIVLDTVSEGGRTPDSSEGNLDDPQFDWLRAELRQASRRGELIVAFGHHAITSLDADVRDEEAGPCEAQVNRPGCDRDPRNSSPIHNGDDLKRLYLNFPNVISYVAGHSHENLVTPYGKRGDGFWEIKSPAIVDWPPQHRLIEVMDNEDGTLSIFGTMLDDASPARAPNGEPAGQMKVPASVERAYEAAAASHHEEDAAAAEEGEAHSHDGLQAHLDEAGAEVSHTHDEEEVDAAEGAGDERVEGAAARARGDVGAQSHVDDFTPDDLSSLGRTLSYNDPQVGQQSEPDDDDPNGKRKDRNVELLIDDPRDDEPAGGPGAGGDGGGGGGAAGGTGTGAGTAAGGGTDGAGGADARAAADESVSASFDGAGGGELPFTGLALGLLALLGLVLLGAGITLRRRAAR